MSFYETVMADLHKSGLLGAEESVLVLAGGLADRNCLHSIGLRKVVISNLAYHAGETDYAPYSWVRLDAEQVDAGDGSFDWVVIHAALHHLAVPAMGVCEMFRVARKGIVCFESRDSVLMRLAVRAGLVSTHELEPIFLSSDGTGGYRNGPIPNYVYRWTEREFEKVISTFAPSHEHTYFYRYGYNIPIERFAMARSGFLRLLGSLLSRLAALMTILLPKQGNAFAFGVLKNSVIQPWLVQDQGTLRFDDRYLDAKYDRSKYWRNRK